MKQPSKPKPKPQRTFTMDELRSVIEGGSCLPTYFASLAREKEAARKLDPRDLANPPHKPPKIDIKF